MFEHYDAVTHVPHNLTETIDYNTANVLLATSSGTKHKILVSGLMTNTPTEITKGNIKYIVNSIAGLPNTVRIIFCTQEFFFTFFVAKFIMR